MVIEPYPPPVYCFKCHGRLPFAMAVLFANVTPPYISKNFTCPCPWFQSVSLSVIATTPIYILISVPVFQFRLFCWGHGWGGGNWFLCNPQAMLKLILPPPPPSSMSDEKPSPTSTDTGITSNFQVRTGVVSCDTLIGFILFTDTDTGTDKQGQVKFLPYSHYLHRWSLRWTVFRNYHTKNV